ncbi:uncharacterized protein LOC127839904 [Dreissena polymorpha]|uniref:uncharacterized protein LOC127839904 n=1 Tax=Dreissena polymorpha TaxID=45954 RepID=UPI0022644E0F|nr:uncharacterized protein LOC127839904 [Dreissena polymorpha]
MQRMFEENTETRNSNDKVPSSEHPGEPIHSFNQAIVVTAHPETRACKISDVKTDEEHTPEQEPATKRNAGIEADHNIGQAQCQEVQNSTAADATECNAGIEPDHNIGKAQCQEVQNRTAADGNV